MACATQVVNFHNVEDYKRGRFERKYHEVSCVHDTLGYLLDISADKCMSLVFREEVQSGDIRLAVITVQMVINFVRPDENIKVVGIYRKEKKGKK